MISALLFCVLAFLLFLSALVAWAFSLDAIKPWLHPAAPSPASSMEPTDPPMLRRLFRSPALRRDSTTASAASTGSSSTVDFYGSQVDNQTVINYSYTDKPSRLLLWDIYYFFYYIWALPYIILPWKPFDSGDLSELAPTRGNIWCVFIHLVLAVLQLLLIICLPPVALILPLWTTLSIVAVFAGVNVGLCSLINANEVLFYSDPEYAAPNQKKFAHEQWVFLNGVACGEHWMKSCLNRLALTFGRPIIGVHNRTDGVIFDVIECLIQRNLGYATNDVRVCYRIVKEKLYNPQYSKIVFILHSQGGIEGGLVLDWLLQELPQNLLSKLEVYTFGNAANHFNNPYRTVASQCRAEEKPLEASLDAVARHNEKPAPGLDKAGAEDTTGKASPRNRSRWPPTPKSSPPPPIRTSTSGLAPNGPGAVASHGLARQETSHLNPATQSERAIGHIEHYAHTTDFVALWGVLHFATSATADRSMPRFIGRLFSRKDARGGHQFVQHYLDGMFPLARDDATGRFVGCKEVGNEFMESEIVIGTSGDAGANEREAFASSYLGCSDDDSDGEQERGEMAMAAGEVLMHNGESPLALRKRLGLPNEKVKVKELSRLWKYRNGRSPVEKPPLLGAGMNGFARNATL
ncbi:hypothetical protein KVR01_012470 [Diaporthe batatas]|uniref:uncharacterized protein n=1 Tax=Diaporthe batatas TaxID=748121 RepID=UPI001D049E5D|nr:uncharacterized protein KVR01_012470 [Diaporthe batatas]KAG8157808.1 hypothetical protein KVR01_012470 [Diaporthe batatas]